MASGLVESGARVYGVGLPAEAVFGFQFSVLNGACCADWGATNYGWWEGHIQKNDSIYWIIDSVLAGRRYHCRMNAKRVLLTAFVLIALSNLAVIAATVAKGPHYYNPTNATPMETNGIPTDMSTFFSSR